jgi:hypothetical protein
VHVALLMLLWSDWVGAYGGKLQWRACTAPGKEIATITVDATDAVMSVDLAPAGGALPALTLVYDDDHQAWSGQSGDVKVTLTHPRDNTISLAVELDSGCTMHGTLARASTGVAACDRLVGWTRIAARCTKREPPDDLAALAKRTWKKTDAATCSDRAKQLASELVDAGCAPDPDAASATFGPACRALADETNRLVHCPRVTSDVLGIVLGLQMLPASHPDPAQRAIAESKCEDGRKIVALLAQRTHCPL